jgi:hypothetical protein
MSWLRQGTSVALVIGPFLDDTDGKTPETGLTITQADIRISKAGGTFAACHDAAGATHGEAGWYALTLDAEDTDTPGDLVLAIAIAGALPVWITHQVVPPAVYDAIVAGSGKLPVDMAQYLGDDCPPALTAGYPVAELHLTQGVPGMQLSGTVGGALKNADQRLDAAVSSRSNHAPADVWAAANRTLTSFGTLVSDIWTAGTRTLTSFGTLVTDIWAALVAGMATAGSVGKLLKDNLDAAVSTRSSHSAADVWAAANRTLTSFGTLASDVWNVLTAGLATAGSIGKLLLDRLDAAVSTRSSHTAADAADAVWDETQADHTVAGSFGAAVSGGEGGEADWSSAERAQIRQALGVDGDKSATASGDIDTLLARTAGAASITVSSPVLSTGKVTLVCSDDYQTAESRQVSFRDVDQGLDLSGATVALLLVERVGNKQTGTPVTVAGTITADGDDAIYAFTLSAAQTAALKIGVNRYFYSVGLTLANGHVLTRAQGLVTTTAQSGATS